MARGTRLVATRKISTGTYISIDSGLRPRFWIDTASGTLYLLPPPPFHPQRRCRARSAVAELADEAIRDLREGRRQD